MKKNEMKKIIIATCIITFCYALGVAIVGFIFKDMEHIYYFSQIFSALFVIGGVVIAMMQYIITSNEQVSTRKRELELREKEILEIEKDRIQNAINLANYYKDNILHSIFIIDAIYEDTGIKEILVNIKLEDMVEFDQHELKKLISPDKQKKIKEIVNSNAFRDALAKNSIVFGFAEQAKVVTTIENDKGQIEKQLTINEMELFREYSNIQNMLLNNTEYFAMNFTHKTADESVVYQSLHTTYLAMMRILYFDISQNNQYGEEKLYTNAIELFNIWRSRAQKQRDGGIELQRGTVAKGTELSYNNHKETH